MREKVITIDSNNIRMLFDDPWYQMVAKLLETIVNSSYEFFRNKKIAPALMPVTTGAVSSPMGLGSDSSPVNISLFGENVYLADSMQFQLEYMTRFNGLGAWYIMPTFRGEEPDERHLNQFFHIEAEIKGGLPDVMQLVEDFVFFLSKEIAANHYDEIYKITGNNSHLDRFLKLETIPKISFEELKREFKGSDEYFTQLENGSETISRKGERALLDAMGEAVWITHFPHLSVPFYQAKNEGSEYAQCADLLMGIGEIVGCGQRHTSYLETMKALYDHRVEPHEYAWYLIMKRDFPIQTSGFGLGVERFLLWALRHQDIRNIPLFQRLKGQTIYP